MKEASDTRSHLIGREQIDFNNTNSSSCLEFTAEQQKTLITTVISVSSVASLACIVAITFILVSKGYKKFVQRVILYLMVAALLEAVVSILQVVPVHYIGDVGAVREGFEGLCAAAGFLINVAVWMELLVVCCIVLVIILVFKSRNNVVKQKHEVIGLAIVLILPFTLNWIPFLKGMYGLSGGGCWIKPSVNSSCNYDYVGLIFMFLLSYGPAFSVCFFALVSFGAMAFAMCKRVLRQDQGLLQLSVHQQGLREVLPLILYPLIYLVLWIALAATRIYDTLRNAHDQTQRYSLVLVHNSFSFVVRLFVPLVFLLHSAINCLRRKRTRPHTFNTTTSFVVPNEFTDQENEPLVIRGQGTMIPSKRYKSIFDDSPDAV